MLSIRACRVYGLIIIEELGVGGHRGGEGARRRRLGAGQWHAQPVRPRRVRSRQQLNVGGGKPSSWDGLIPA